MIGVNDALNWGSLVELKSGFHYDRDRSRLSQLCKGAEHPECSFDFLNKIKVESNIVPSAAPNSYIFVMVF